MAADTAWFGQRTVANRERRASYTEQQECSHAESQGDVELQAHIARVLVADYIAPAPTDGGFVLVRLFHYRVLLLIAMPKRVGGQR